MPLLSDAEAFKTILWKCYLLELNSVSKYIWSIAAVLIFGYGFGTGAKYSPPEMVPIGMNIFMFLMCGMIGRTIAINLIRDRKVKFRLTLQLVGVKQSVYLAANFFFSLAWGLLQVAGLLVTLIFFCLMMNDSQQPKSQLPFSFMDIAQFLIHTVLFLLAYLAMCAAFSGLITQYDFSGEIISKFTFLGLFLPIAFVVSTVLNSIANGNIPQLNSITHVSYIFIWLPNVSYLQLGIIKTLEMIKSREQLPDGYEPGAAIEFDIVLLLQFICYLVLYYFIDRYFSNDTGGQRQIIGAAANRLKESNDDTGQGLAQPLNADGGKQQNNIKIVNLVKKFGDFSAIRGVSQDIYSNVITCLLGHNGAGKTTLIDILTGFQTPTEGGVYFNGRNIHTNIELLYGNVGYASSHDPLFDELRVRDFLILIARLKGIPNPMAEADRVAMETNLQPHMNKLIKECSGGTKRRISISSSIVGNPPLIFLDEPSTGVDPENRRALWEAIWHMKKPNRIILLTTHHLEEAEFLSQDVIIMSKGQISIRGNPDQIKSELGVGYKIVLNHMKPKRDAFIAKFTRWMPYFTMVEDRFQSIGEIILVMKKNTNDVVPEMLRQLEEDGTSYTLLASTLEDAFINLGEMDETLEEEERRKDIIERLFVQKFKTNIFNKLIALQIRKFFLLFRSMLQIIVVIMLISFPASVYCLIVAFAFNSINSILFSTSEIIYRLDPYWMAIINIICIIYYTFSCGFFGLIPVVERVGRIRYLMKMNNVSPFYYFPTLLIPDAFIAGCMVMVTYLVSYVGTHDFYSYYSLETFFMLEGNLLVWMLTFITQSYCLSFMFGSKDTAYKRLTNVLLMANILALVVMVYVTDNNRINNSFMQVFNVLFPGYMNLQFCFNAIISGKDLQLTDMMDALMCSSICFFIFFPLACVLDFFDARIKRADNKAPPVIPNAQQDQQIFDPQGVDAERKKSYEESTEYPLQIRGVFKYFSAFKALDNVSITLKPSETLGLIGPNGAGKSTLFNIVSNYIAPSFGELKYKGRYLDEIPSFYDNTGLCAQDDIIWPELSVDQHLSFYGHLKGVDPVTLKLWKSLMGLESFGSFSASHLSTGMKRKLCYIISMMSNPTYKFLDEPTSGLDPVSRKLMRKLILAQKRIYGGTCVFTTHTMRDAEDLCDRVAILVNGKLTVIDTVNNLRSKTGGINVSFMRNLGNPNRVADEQNIYAVYGNTFSECLEDGQPILIDRTERKLVFFAYKAENIPKKLEILMDLKKQGIIFDFELSQRSLEDLFLYLVRHQQVRQN